MTDLRPLRIALASDHAGVALKDHVAGWLRARGMQVVDHGTHGGASVHYPTYAIAVARAVAAGEVDLGVLVCGTGQGMAMTANRVPGVRAGVVCETFSARAIREHNDANVLCLGGRVVGPGLAEACLQAFLEATFQGGRHAERVAMMTDLERRGDGPARG
ncbi:MAG: ribose 5-phosphate isomerase B [Deltaproteobacteria bacterium]|nr:ribose 5-phosphate isomerase B [Deltaproteobacteria bacterium]